MILRSCERLILTFLYSPFSEIKIDKVHHFSLEAQLVEHSGKMGAGNCWQASAGLVGTELLAATVPSLIQVRETGRSAKGVPERAKASAKQ